MNKTRLSLAVIGCFLFTSVNSAGAFTRIEDFSLYGFVAQNVERLAEDIVALGVAQSSFNNDIAEARLGLKTNWDNPVARDAAATRLAELLFQKDLLYALIPISEGVTTGWERSKVFNQLAGAPLDGGISAYASAGLLHWVETLRGHLGAYEQALISPVKVADWNELRPAIEKSQSAYRRYARVRDDEELARFLPLLAPRLAADGSAAFKEQIIDVFNPFGWGVSHTQPLGAQLRSLGEQQQPMLECVYGPIRIRADGRERNVYAREIFWYKNAPKNIQALLDMNSHPTLSGMLGGLAELGTSGLERCPATEKEADALHAANIASHPATLRRAAEKEAEKSRIQDSCGSDARCARQKMRGR